MFVTARTPLYWLSNLKVQIERSPGAVYFIRSQGKHRIQLPSAFLGGRQKVGRELFLSEAEREKRAHTKQNKTDRHTHHKPIHQSPPGPYIWHFPQSFQDHGDRCVSAEFLAYGLKWGLNVPALEKYLIFNSQGFFRYTIMRNDQAHISDLPEICLYYALRLPGLLKWG